MSNNPNRGRGPPEERPGRGASDGSGRRGPPDERPGRGPPGRESETGDEEGPIQLSGNLSHELDDVRACLTPSVRRELTDYPGVETVGVGVERADSEQYPVIRAFTSRDHPGGGDSTPPETITLECGEIPILTASLGGKFTPDSGSEAHPGSGSAHRTKRVRPMPGGVEVGLGGRPASSSALVEIDDRDFIVMARHAVADGRVDPDGKYVYSPATASQQTRIGEVARVAPWHRGTRRSPADAVLVRVETDDEGDPVVSPTYLGHAPARGTVHSVNPGTGRRVVHMAATSGFAGGSIIATDVDAAVTYGFGEIRYENLIVTDLPGGSGASGAAVGVFDLSTGRLHLVGIHIASSPNAGLVVPWSNLRDAFGDHIAPQQ